MSKRILLYYPPNKRSVSIETLCKVVATSGHELIVLTLTEKDCFHESLEKMGITTYAHTFPRRPSWKYFLHHCRYLIGFCKKHKIDIIWSHLQEANIIALLAQPFLEVEVVPFRHHAESAFYAEYGEHFGMQRNKNEVRLDKIINRLARKMVIPSSGVWYSMEKYENYDMSRIRLIPYIYDFSDYAKPDPVHVQNLKDQYRCHLMLIMVSRMIPTKQHLPVLRIVGKLIQEGLSIKMILMDDGPLKPQIEKFITENGLETHILLPGFRNDFIDFMAVSDILIHPSLTEASNNVVKEMGLMEKAVAVCRDVGDFNDYIEDERNGFLIDRKNLEISVEEIIRRAYADKEQLKSMGRELKRDVLNRFSDSVENRAKLLSLIED